MTIVWVAMVIMWMTMTIVWMTIARLPDSTPVHPSFAELELLDSARAGEWNLTTTAQWSHQADGMLLVRMRARLGHGRLASAHTAGSKREM